MPSRIAAIAVVLCVTGCATAKPAPAPVRDPDSILFGIAAYGGTQLGESDANALATELTHRMGKRIHVIVFAEESSLAEALAQGGIDAAWMPPLSFTLAKSHAAVTPIVKALRHGHDHYRSVIFVHSGSGITSLKELQGKSIAWVDKRSAAGYMYPRALFQLANLNPSDILAKETFSGNHDAVCRAVLEGRVDAGATFMDDHPADEAQQIDGCIQSLGADDAAKLVAISVSKSIPNDLVALRANCPANVAASFKSVLLGLGKDADGKSFLTTVFKADGFAPVSPQDFGI